MGKTKTHTHEKIRSRHHKKDKKKSKERIERPRKRIKNIGQSYSAKEKSRPISPDIFGTDEEPSQPTPLNHLQKRAAQFTAMEIEKLCILFLKNRQLLDGTSREINLFLKYFLY